MKITIYKLNPCKRCGGQPEFRHVKSMDLQYLITFHFHPNQYYCACGRCGAKTPSKPKPKLAIKDWNERNKE